MIVASYTQHALSLANSAAWIPISSCSPASRASTKLQQFFLRLLVAGNLSTATSSYLKLIEINRLCLRFTTGFSTFWIIVWTSSSNCHRVCRTCLTRTQRLLMPKYDIVCSPVCRSLSNLLCMLNWISDSGLLVHLSEVTAGSPYEKSWHIGNLVCSIMHTISLSQFTENFA